MTEKSFLLIFGKTTMTKPIPKSRKINILLSHILITVIFKSFRLNDQFYIVTDMIKEQNWIGVCWDKGVREVKLGKE